jgi:hypothetical protein
VLLGGGISRYSLDDRAARRLAVEAGALARASGGSLLICGSYRTPSSALEILARSLDVPAEVFDWHRGARNDNPYLAFLGLASEIVVSGDSMSMLAEACATDKPVHIFDLGEGRYTMRQTPRNHPPLPVPGPWRASALRARLMDAKVRLINAILPQRLHRDTRRIHARLVESGRADWLGDATGPGGTPTAANALAAVIARVRALF